jgi:hypothetical protein
VEIQNLKCSKIWSLLSTSVTLQVENSTSKPMSWVTDKNADTLKILYKIIRLYVFVKCKWILCLDLRPISKIFHFVYAIFQNPKKILNLKHFWSQAFQIRDTQTAHLLSLFLLYSRITIFIFNFQFTNENWRIYK